ncbi:MAG: peptidoglycan DD-metalloendopeptidase family protein [Bacilli bacterium]|nr:peptidoglycan DD-metalloendopeptidase family protein [Bacilli bacterium]
MDEVISNDYSVNHQALDIVSDSNLPSEIIALDSGIVETVVNNKVDTDHNSKGLDTYGNYVKIKQNNGKSALYAHMKHGSVNVNVGDYVEKGAIIGTMGETGNAYGKHLHLEVKNENSINENPIISLNEPKQEINETPINQEIKQENTIQPITKQSENPTQKNNNLKQSQKNIEKDQEYFFSSYSGGSIVDALKSISVDSSYNYRSKLAQENNIEDYHGTYQQNIYLLNLLKEGKLKKA